MTPEAQVDRPVLVALDGSQLAETALPWAIRLATKWRAPLLLVRVVERHILGAEGFIQASPAVTDAEDESAAAYLRDQAAILRSSHPQLTVQTELAHGDPTLTLLEIEQLSGARLAVLTTHGRTGLARWARGSVAESIARYGAAPVLLVLPWDQPLALTDSQDSAQRGLRVVVPLDGSTLARSVLPLAQELAQGIGGELILTAMVQTHPEREIGAGYRPRTDEQRREARHYLDRLCADARDEGISARSVVGVEHDVARAIVDFASIESADLIALSTHGRGALGRLLYGSIADRVAHAARVPVLLYRPPVVPASPTPHTVDSRTPALVGV